MIDFYLIEKVMFLRKQGEKAALVTIIRTKGSTPRKIASKMLVYPSGEIEGTIGGGCGEGEVIETALNVIESKIPLKYTVDLTDGFMYEDGGICGGIFEVFIEPVKSTDDNDFKE